MAKFKKGDLVEILNVHMESDLGIIIKQGNEPTHLIVDSTGKANKWQHTKDEWLVHLINGHEVWLWTNEIRNVKD